MRESIDFLNRIKQLAIVAMFSDDELMETLAAEYAPLSNDQINDRVINSPIQGIIDL